MPNKEKIIEEHKKIIDNIKRHNKNYFIDDSPKISDSEFDKIKKSALDLEVKFPFFEKDRKCARFSGFETI